MRVGGKLQAMRRIVKTFRRPPTGRLCDRNGGFPRLSDVVARVSRCTASPRRTLPTENVGAENLGKPSLWVFISDPWYEASFVRPGPARIIVRIHLETAKPARNLLSRQAKWVTRKWSRISNVSTHSKASSIR